MRDCIRNCEHAQRRLRWLVLTHNSVLCHAIRTPDLHPKRVLNPVVMRVRMGGPAPPCFFAVRVVWGASPPRPPRCGPFAYLPLIQIVDNPGHQEIQED